MAIGHKEARTAVQGTAVSGTAADGVRGVCFVKSSLIRYYAEVEGYDLIIGSG